MFKTITAFDKTQHPENLLTLQDYRVFVKKTKTAKTPIGGAKKIAQAFGGAFLLKADGSLLVFKKQEAGTISQKIYKPNTWRWA